MPFWLSSAALDVVATAVVKMYAVHVKSESINHLLVRQFLKDPLLKMPEVQLALKFNVEVAGINF